MAQPNVKTTNIEYTEQLKNHLNEKLESLGRHADSNPIHIDIELEKLAAHQSGPIYRCEINVDMPRDKHVLRAESTEYDIYAAIDTCMPKIKTQLDERREKRETMVKKGGRKFKEMMRNLWPDSE